jgi:RNA polymerase sigma-70 factor (ECF subfamily)
MEGPEEAMANVALKEIAPVATAQPGIPSGVRVRPTRGATATAPAVDGRSIRESLRSAEDSTVVEAFLAGEYRAFEELVARYHVRLINFVYRTIGDREKAEDLVQEVFIRVYRHLHRFDRGKKFSTWVYTIASNLAKNELRNRSRNPLVLFQAIKRNWEDEDRPLQFEDSASRPDDLYRKRHLREIVEAAVARLPEHHRQVFVLRELEGKSYEEIAEITACNLGTVKSRLNRARTSFADIIAPALK